MSLYGRLLKNYESIESILVTNASLDPLRVRDYGDVRLG
jgi:hypothetical protein